MYVRVLLSFQCWVNLLKPLQHTFFCAADFCQCGPKFEAQTKGRHVEWAVTIVTDSWLIKMQYSALKWFIHFPDDVNIYVFISYYMYYVFMYLFHFSHFADIVNALIAAKNLPLWKKPTKKDYIIKHCCSKQPSKNYSIDPKRHLYHTLKKHINYNRIKRTKQIRCAIN